MRKTYLLSSVIVLTLFIAGTVFAEVSTSSVNRINEIKQKIIDVKQQSAENKARIKAEIASTTNAIKDIKQELKSAAEIRIGKKLDVQKNKVADAFEKSIQNLKDLMTRVGSRITKMQINNINVSASQILLDMAKTKITLAETELKNLENMLAQNVPNASTSTLQNKTRKALLNGIKLQSDKTKSAIKTAHSSIVKVISSLKPGQNEAISSSTNN